MTRKRIINTLSYAVCVRGNFEHNFLTFFREERSL